MRIIISPAKKMNTDTDSLLWQDLPVFLPKTEELVKTRLALASIVKNVIADGLGTMTIGVPEAM